MIPREILHTHPRSYSRYDVLSTLDDQETQDYLFGQDDMDDMDDGLPQVHINEALWELGPELLEQLQQNFQPLSLSDDIDTCMDRYKHAIDFIYENIL